MAPASIAFSVSSQIALSGWVCECAMMLIAFHWSPIWSVPVVVCGLAAEERGMGGHVTKGWEGWHLSQRILAPDSQLRKGHAHSQFPQVPLSSTSVTAGIP